jgi:hypothetical protein
VPIAGKTGYLDSPNITFMILFVSLLFCPPFDSSLSKVQSGSINSNRLCLDGKVLSTNVTSNHAEEGSAVMVTNTDFSFFCQLLV